MLNNIVKAVQYANLVSAMKKYSDDVKKDLNLNTIHDIEKRAREIIYG